MIYNIYLAVETEEELQVIDEISDKPPARVILFNDEWHSFEEVISQIIKATKCSWDKAEELTFEVHNTGKACVFEGSVSECLSVSGILEEINLHTLIEI